MRLGPHPQALVPGISVHRQSPFQTRLLLSGSRSQGGSSPHSVGLAVSDRRRFGASIRLRGDETQCTEASGGDAVAVVTGGVEAGPPHIPDGVVAWREVRGLAQGRVASTQQAGRARGSLIWVGPLGPRSLGPGSDLWPLPLTDSKGLSNPAEVEALREKVYASLEAYCKHKYPEQPGR